MLLYKYVLTPDKKLLETKALPVNSNSLNRVVNAPLLHGKAMYDLKKNKAVEFVLQDGLLRYELKNKTSDPSLFEDLNTPKKETEENVES